VNDFDERPAQTVQCEMGVRHRFGPRTGISLCVFSKRTKNAPWLQQVFDDAGNSFFTYFNDSDRKTNGLELQWAQKYGRHFTSDMSYTVQETKFVYTSRNAPTLPNTPGIEFPIDWDQRRKLVFIGTLKFGENEGARLGKLHLFENLNASAVARWASGLPYTPSTLSGLPLVEQTNTKRFPETFEIDVRLQRSFNLGQTFRLGAVFEVRNLMNRRNAVGLDDGGIIDTYRDKIGFTNIGTSMARNYGGFNNSSPHPAAWRHGRIVQVGILAEF
jgi:hypothetical protein